MPRIQDLLQDYSKGIVREHLKKIVEIYDPEWYIVHELVQNAIDAVQTNPRVVEGNIFVELDLDSDQVTVQDNGTGFMFDLELLCPGGSGMEKRLSSRSPAKGYQGVGLKAVMYSTCDFKIESQTQEKKWTFHAEHLASYLDENSQIEPIYEIADHEVSTGMTGTKIEAKFNRGMLKFFLESIGRFLDEDSVKWKQLYKQEQDQLNHEPYTNYVEHFLRWYFQTQSYIGCVNRLINIPVKNSQTLSLEEIKPTNITLQLKSTNKFTEIRGVLGNWLNALNSESISIDVVNRAWDFAEIIQSNESRASKYRIAPKLVTMKPTDANWEILSEQGAFRDRFLDLKLKPNENESEFRKKYADFIWLLERRRSSVKAEDFEDVLDKITGIYLAIGRTSHFETLGVPNRGLRILASNGTVTEHDLTISSTSSTWYLETIHMIINLDATLNLGKRHLANTRLVGRVREFFKACYPTLVTVSKLFVERDSGSTSDEPLPEVIGLGVIRREGIPYRRFPKDENTLIGIFSAVIAQRDPEFSIYGLFSRARYDGKYTWDSAIRISDADLKKFEFKLDLEALIQEFDASVHDKEFTDLELIVVWDRRINSTGWDVKGISAARRIQLENSGVPTDVVEYILEDRYGHFCPLICVADLLVNLSFLANTNADDLAEYVKKLG